MRGITSLGLAPCLLLTVIAAAALVAGLENDDLVFDHDNKLSAADTLAEQESSLLHSLWNWLNLKTDFFSSSPVKSSGQLDKSVESNSLFNTDPRRKREVKEDNKVISDDPSYPYKSRNYKDDTSIRPKLSEKYQQGDDEDDAGSGEPDGEREVEGSAISYDYFATQPTTISHSNPVTQSNFIDQSNEFAEKNVYRISMTIKEPYREEFERRDGEKFKKFAENLTKTVEDLLHQHLRKEDHVTFVKMENAPDPFESHVHLDVHTMSKEAEVRDVLERHVNIYHSLGKFTVIPASFVLRAVLECQPGEIACDVSRCILQTQRCDFKSDCADGSDEAGCKYPVCAPGEFMCNNGQCIREDLRCNDISDCYDHSDEDNCLTTCSIDEFRCLEGICISIDKRCNGYPDCRSGDDEESCDQQSVTQSSYNNNIGTQRCRSDQFECSPGYCISNLDVCNNRADCPDGIDERNCYNHRPTEEKRLSIEVYPHDQIIKENSEVVFQCRDEGPLRAKVRWVRGNGRPLPPGSHTENGRLEIPNIQLEHSGSYICEAEHYTYLPGHQVTAQLTVEKHNEIFYTPQKMCQQNEATCSNEECIPKHYVCDGKPDCSDGSDEIRCGHHGCEPNEFRCTNKQCVGKVWRCDGDRDCTDGSDEENCSAAPFTSPCNYGEFKCHSNDQCIPKRYHCDQERDCDDGSDEIGCSLVHIVKPPPPMMILDEGDTLSLTCTAIGVPIPEVNWRLNWGHIPQKCATTSINGTGTLDCPDVRIEDQGAYSCEGINVMGFVIAVPDTILVVKNTTVCPMGKFNSEAKRPEDCISCFCFGVATECQSANLFSYQIPLPVDRYKLIPVEMRPEIRIPMQANITDTLSLDADGYMQGVSNEINRNNIIYYGLPEHFNGNQLKSYGGYLRWNYDVRHNNGNGYNNGAPTVIVSGNGQTLIHNKPSVPPEQESSQKVRFIYGEWNKQLDRRGQTLASREDIMMVLVNVNNILIKAQFDNSPQLNHSISNVMLDSAQSTGIDLAPFVEECQCSAAYTGLSCENCASGYTRRKTGRYLGPCYKEIPPVPSCPRTFYGDPSRGIPCTPCPCLVPNPSDRICRLGPDYVSPICDCPAGYTGKICENCTEGYSGTPARGEACTPHDQCDRSGSLSTELDPYTRECRCKEYVTGPTCNQCKANTFSLASTNQFGCISCFCMGITSSCVSSDWYRNEIRVSFTNSPLGFSLIGSKDHDSAPIVSGINLRPETREIVFNDFPDRGAGDVYYWQLPNMFLGNQITAYGGNLKYIVRHVPSPGGLTSRNSAADVELVSSNGITLLYYSREFPEPNNPKTFTVPLLEQHWQRADGTNADREHLLMVLAGVEAIRIKATYTTHTNEAALSYVSLDIAEDFNTGNQRAIEVEKCNCPLGYQGPSCEECAVGYYRAMEGIYLGICEPCRCNNHSNQCESETGICENCADHTTGDNCEICESGYEGDPSRGSPDDCQRKNGTDIPCHCNPLGSLSSVCHNGQCHCKRNVEGAECNRCRLSTFGLSQSNPDGCNECFCSGVSNQCHESSLFIQQIPTFIFENEHGFILTDSSRRQIINDGFEVDVAVNQIGYRFSNNRVQRLFWSLPNAFTGNKVKSYGGNLSLTQKIVAPSNTDCYKDQDVILIGNEITLYWTNPESIIPGQDLVYSVPLKESEWRHLSSTGLRVATRSDLMKALANIDAILVRASYCDDMAATYLSDITLDTAAEGVSGSPRATQVEACRCPPGYVGTSCETCAPGYYRNLYDRSVSILGSCSPCPCNGREQSCELDWSGHVNCICRPQYTGQFCQESADYTPSPSTVSPTTAQPSPIVVTITEPKIQIVKIGESVRYRCSGSSLFNEPVTVNWEKENGYLPQGRAIDDSHGLLVITEVKVSDSGTYVCRVTDGVYINTEKVTLYVGEQPELVISPPYQKVLEGDSVEFHCKATGPTQVLTKWVRQDGALNPNATVDDGILRIPSVTFNDAAVYKCIGRSRTGSSEKTTQLHVQARNRDPLPDVAVIVSPPKWNGFSGDTVRLTCNASRPVQQVVWSRTDRLLLPSAATQNNGILTIANPSSNDAGWYICTVTLHDGSEKSTTTSVTINPRHDMPTVFVEPQRQTVPQGTTATVQCKTNGDESNVKWIKSRESSLGANAQPVGNTLRITNIQVANRGIYTCRISNEHGTYEASAIIEVEPREMPILEIYPKEPQTVLEGNTADLHCRAMAGIPSPTIRWSRQDNRPLSSNSVTTGGMLRIHNVTSYDSGPYVCVGENSVGVTSATVTLDVHSLPRITINPHSGVLTLKTGDMLHLICSATGYPQPMVFWSKDVKKKEQWLVDPYLASKVGPSATIDINSVSTEDEGTYTCKASSPAGVIEDYVQLRIEDDDTYVPEEEPPKTNGLVVDRISNIPSGGQVTMRCELSPYPEDKGIYLDWRREDGQLLPRGSSVNEGTLFINEVKKEDSGNYTCFGLDTYGKQVFTAITQLNVLDFPKIELKPTKQTVRPGDSPSIHCVASGEKPLNVEWEAVGRSLPPTVSQSNGVLQFYGIKLSDAGKYVCKAWNDLGTAESVAEVYVEATAAPIVKVQASKNPVTVGDTVNLHCVTSGLANPRYVWSTPFEISLPHNAIEAGNILTIMDVNMENNAVYRCAVNSEDGVVEADFNLRVQDGETSTEDLLGSQKVRSAVLGKNVDIPCRDRLQPPTRYRWNKINGSLPVEHQVRDDVLTLIEVDGDAAGVYSCQANNGQETTETFTTVVVTGLVPYFSQAPLSYMELPPLADAFLRFDVEISFRPENANGILLYTSGYPAEFGDFLILSLENGYPVFKFDLGSGVTVIKSDRIVSLKNWHTILIKRDRKEGEMLVDNQYSYKAISRGKKDGFDVHYPLYVGGIAENLAINENAGENTGFVGCINRLVVGGKQINLMKTSVMSQSITNCEICEDNPCSYGVCQESSAKDGYECLCNVGYSGTHCQNIKQSCQPGLCGDGVCHETEDSYVCDCPSGKVGQHCEYSQMIRTPKLSHPRSYLAYPTPKSTRRHG